MALNRSGWTETGGSKAIPEASGSVDVDAAGPVPSDKELPVRGDGADRGAPLLRADEPPPLAEDVFAPADAEPPPDRAVPGAAAARSMTGPEVASNGG